jgi:hypothetical protein
VSSVGTGAVRAGATVSAGGGNFPLAGSEPVCAMADLCPSTVNTAHITERKKAVGFMKFGGE